MELLKVGVIGAGNIGGMHCKNIINGEIPNMYLAAICDIDNEKRAYLKKKFPFVEVFSDYKKFLKSADIDAVIIAVPHPLHAEIAIAAFKAGKHVMLEKPIDISVASARRLCDCAKKSERRFAIMLNQRTNVLFKKAREIVKSGEIGELCRSVWIITNWFRTQSYYNSSDWRASWSGEGGGVLLNQAPHNLDIWQWICGMPSAVTAFCTAGKFHDIEVEDEATIYAEYENGATGVFITSTGDYPGTNRFEISGTNGKIVLENGILKLWKLAQSVREVCASSQSASPSIKTEYFEFYDDGNAATHIKMLQNFANSVLFNEELTAKGEEGINELMISNAAYLSQWKKNAKISLDFDEEEFLWRLCEKRKNSRKKTSVKKTIDCEEARWHVKW